MPRSNRAILLAAVGIAAFGLWFFVVDLASVSRSYERIAANASNHYRDDANKQIADTCLRPPGINEPNCAREIQNSARENQREEQDLAAQKMTAWWTQIMGVAALIGMALSAVGVFLVWTTFRETRRTAEIARLNLASYQHAERGFVRIEKAHFFATVGLMSAGNSLAFTISNPGRSGVNITKLHAGTREDATNWGWAEEHQFISIRPTYCKPDETAHIIGPRIPTDPEHKVFLGIIEYDTLGIPCKTHFAYALLRPIVGARPSFVRIEMVEGMPRDT